MIKLSNIVNEINRSRGISRPIIRGLIQKRFSQAAIEHIAREGKDYGPLFRGLPHPGNYYIIYPKKHTRTSQTFAGSAWIRDMQGTNNFHTALIDLLPSWKGWPKRSRSVIFVNDHSEAEKYGTPYLVLPEDNAKICVCLSEDFWNSFGHLESRTGMAIFALDEAMADILDGTQIISNRDVLNSVSSVNLRDYLGALSVVYEKEPNVIEQIMLDERISEEFWLDIKEHYRGDWIKYFSDLLAPENNGFKLVGVKEAFGYDNTREMFTESPCLLINEKVGLPKEP